MTTTQTKRASAEEYALARDLRYPRVIEMAITGTPHAKIAEELGVSVYVVREDIQHALEAEKEYREQIGDKYMALQMQRYEELLAKWFPIAQAVEPGDKRAFRNRAKLDPKTPTFMQASTATDKVLRIMNDVNKLLTLGTYANTTAVNESTAPELVFQQFNTNVTVHNASDPPAYDVIDGTAEPERLVSGNSEGNS